MKHTGYLLAALALLALAAFSMREPEAPRLRRQALAFPRYARLRDIERHEARKTLALPAPQPVESGANDDDPEPQPGTPRQLADPVLVALSSPDEMAIVLEARPLQDSPIGRMLLACQSPDSLAELERFEQRAGLRVFEQLDRIGITSGDGEPVMVLSGDFSSFDPGFAAPDSPVTTLGDARVFEDGHMSVAVWGEQLIVIGKPNGVNAALDRLAGDLPAPEPFPSGEAYGEVYGSLSAASLSRLVPQELRERVSGAVERVLVHVDATDDLLLVADVRGPDEEALADLARSIAGALSLGRLQAVREDDQLLADLLDESRVIPSPGSFQLEVALPLATVERQLGECARNAR